MQRLRGEYAGRSLINPYVRNPRAKPWPPHAAVKIPLRVWEFQPLSRLIGNSAFRAMISRGRYWYRFVPLGLQTSPILAGCAESKTHSCAASSLMFVALLTLIWTYDLWNLACWSLESATSVTGTPPHEIKPDNRFVTRNPLDWMIADLIWPDTARDGRLCCRGSCWRKFRPTLELALVSGLFLAFWLSDDCPVGGFIAPYIAQRNAMRTTSYAHAQ